MQITFEEIYLKELYTKGTSFDKKHRYQPQVIRGYQKAVKLAIHPGEMIKDEIEARGLSQRQLAEQMEVSPSVLNEVLNGKRPVSTEYALMLEAVLGIDAGIWLRLQLDYNMQVTKSNNTFLAKLEKLRKVAAVL